MNSSTGGVSGSMAVRFTSEFVHGYNVRVEEETPGLWTMVASAEGHTPLRFSNVYESTERALRDAEDFACYALESWGIRFVGLAEWRAASSDVGGPDEVVRVTSRRHASIA